MRLRFGVSDALETIDDRLTCSHGRHPRQNVGLVELTLAFSRRVERYRDECVEGFAGDAGIAEGIHEPLREEMAQVVLTVIFEAMDEAPDNVLTAMGCSGVGEVEAPIRAIRACKGAVDLAVKGMRADIAERCLDSPRSSFAPTAKPGCARGIRPLPALHAMRRIEQIDKRLTGVARV
jgi:hypothetical protein